jgi:hypothetical protein
MDEQNNVARNGWLILQGLQNKLTNIDLPERDNLEAFENDGQTNLRT